MKTQKVNLKKAAPKVVSLSNKTGTHNESITKSNSVKTPSSQAKNTHKKTLTHTMIAQRAQRIWEKNGRRPGRDEQNWLEAEKQLKLELGIS